MNVPIEWEDNPDYGELMTLEEFRERCRLGLFIDYDGSAYFSDGKRMARNVPISPSILRDMAPINPTFSHIMWFNK